MNKILNYFKSGRGIGAKWLLLYSFVVALIFAFAIRSHGTQAIPTLQHVADQLLPLRVENGIIVEPAETVKSIDLGLKGADIPFILDTTLDTIDTTGLKDGVYISRKAVYVVNNHKTKVYNFEDSFTLERGDYTGLFRSVINYASVFIGVFTFVGLYVLVLALTCFYALFAMLFNKVFKSSMDYAACMRLSAIAYLATSLVINVLRFSGLSVANWVFFAAVLALQAICTKMLAKA